MHNLLTHKSISLFAYIDLQVKFINLCATDKITSCSTQNQGKKAKIALTAQASRYEKFKAQDRAIPFIVYIIRWKFSIRDIEAGLESSIKRAVWTAFMNLS